MAEREALLDMAEDNVMDQQAADKERESYRSYKNWRMIIVIIGTVLSVGAGAWLFVPWLNYDNLELLRAVVNQSYVDSGDFDGKTAGPDWQIYLLWSSIIAIGLPLMCSGWGITLGVNLEQTARDHCKRGDAINKQDARKEGKNAQLVYAVPAGFLLAGAVVEGVLAIHHTIVWAANENDDEGYHFLLILIGGWIATGGMLILGGLFVFLSASVGDICSVNSGGVRNRFNRARMSLASNVRSARDRAAGGARSVRDRLSRRSNAGMRTYRSW